MPADSPNASGLAALADHLATRRDAVFATWKARTDRDLDGSAFARLSGAEFLDHLPAVLDELDATLRRLSAADRPEIVRDTSAETGSESEAAVEHGAHRWQQGFNLRQMTREWGHLHLAILRETDAYAAATPELPAAAMAAGREIIAAVMHQGVAESVAEFHRLQRLEAEARAGDLAGLLARYSQESRSRGEHLREASHDLKGGLSIVQSAAYVLGGQVDDAERAEMVSLITTATEDLAAMLSNLLDLARLEAGLEERQVEAFDAAELLRSLCETSRPLAAAAGLKLAAHGPDELRVRGDRVKTRRVAQNLLLNALKYTREGGVEVEWQGDSGCWSFEVRDTGPGLPAGNAAALETELFEATRNARDTDAAPPRGPAAEADLSDAAEPATAAHSADAEAVAHHGEGVGLAIVRRLCELLDATMEAVARPERGSTFRVVLPRDYDPHRPETPRVR